MNAKENIFVPLLERIETLSEDSLYIPDFDFQNLITKLRTNILIDTPNDSLKQLEKALNMIAVLLENDRDFHARLFQLQIQKHTFPDENGNLNFEEVTTHVPLPERQRDNVNAAIRMELEYYRNHLLQLQKSAIFSQGRYAQKLDSKAIQRKLPYVYSGTHPGNVKALFNALQTNQFIDESVEWKEFSNVFLGKAVPSRKIYWTGGKTKSGASTLSYFVRQLFKLKLIESKSERVDWQTVREIFTLSAEGEEIQNDLKTQKIPQKEYKLLDEIILGFSKK